MTALQFGRGFEIGLKANEVLSVMPRRLLLIECTNQSFHVNVFIIDGLSVPEE
jgi:hypothetical protein